MNFVYSIVAAIGLCTAVAAVASGEESPQSARSAERRGQKIWFENTYGGEKFFSFLANHPDPARRVNVAFEEMISTPRSQRFQEWGTINDPDCRANPAGGPDICPNPEATGVIGVRRKLGADGKARFGISCASCHAGFHPLFPPQDVNEPKWKNIHPTIGNQFLDSGKAFAHNMSATDIRRLMFAAWPKGTVDTTLLFSDNIMNPGVITAFWNVKHRPKFEVGLSTPKIRSGQGGEDDLGSDFAALRVYTNIGSCFAECVAPNPTAPIDIPTCRQKCADFPPQGDLDDLGKFLLSIRSPQYPKRAGDFDAKSYRNGAKLFKQNCASCHSQDGRQKHILSNDEVNPLSADPLNATNSCRAKSTNWEEGRIWTQFSSSVYKQRVAAGQRGYRTMPLTGIWATSPFLHNQSVGPWAAANAAPKVRAIAYETAMLELLSRERTPLIHRSPIAVGPFPAGTPLTAIFSRNPATGELNCDDVVENRGHHYGSDLSLEEKKNLIHWLKFQ